MDETQILELFAQCDVSKRGWLTLDDLRRVCPQLGDDELRYIFDLMDANRNGRIEREEFCQSFNAALLQGEKRGFSDMRRRASIKSKPVLKAQAAEVVYDSDPERLPLDIALPCQDEVIALYEQLHSTGVPQLLTQFEMVIGNFCREIKEQKEQNDRLHHVYDNERERYSRRMAEVENELDQQLLLTEQKAREEERARLTREKDEMRRQLEGEMAELQSNITRLQKMETLLKRESEKADHVKELKLKMQDVSVENRDLKTSLADSQLEMALIKAELAQLRAEHETNTMELMSDKETLVASIHEQDNITRQLQLLYDANKKLHDTNDSLRSALEQRSTICRQFNLRSPSPGILSRETSICGGSIAGSIVPRDRLVRPLNLTPGFRNSFETDDDIDSGLADSQSMRNGGYSGFSSEGTGTDGEVTVRSVASLHSQATLTNGHQMLRQQNSTEPTGPPERTFRVVLAGDASVGKSSLIMRLIKGTFTGNLPSTLGVDFHVKGLRVDDQNVAVQLWDTAGQERFRSLCKSYFRRADGAFLVYDCTSEQSFIHVRNWIDTITESVNRTIPVVLCANKIDLRVAAASDGRRVVSTEDGSRLAATYGAQYVETSAKDGTNVYKALVELTRELLAQQDVDVNGSRVVLKSSSSSTASGCFNRPSCTKS